MSCSAHTIPITVSYRGKSKKIEESQPIAIDSGSVGRRPHDHLGHRYLVHGPWSYPPSLPIWGLSGPIFGKSWPMEGTFRFQINKI